MDKLKGVALILAKGSSKRLKGKNTLDFNGKPMFLVNVLKCLEYFDDVYVSSDDQAILNMAELVGAKPIWRDESLCGDTPNIPVYQHALAEMGEVDYIVAVQANSPTIRGPLIWEVQKYMEKGAQEVMTVHPQVDHLYRLYGSIWALSTIRLKNYGDPFSPTPELLIPDESVDIHTAQDYQKALKQCQ